MKIITTANAADYYAWFALALADDGVWPFLSMTPRTVAAKIEDDDWERRVVMDDGGTCAGILGFNRNGEKSAHLCVWVLSGKMRAVTASTILRDMILLGARYDLQWIDSTVHESNEPSLRIHQKFFGHPWGAEPSGAWNGRLRKYEQRICYRAHIDVLEARLAERGLATALSEVQASVA